MVSQEATAEAIGATLPRMWATVSSSLARLLARYFLYVVGASVLLSILSGALALKLDVKTAFQDVLSPQEPTVARLRYLSENFPGAVTIQVVVEGRDPERIIAVAKALEGDLLDANNPGADLLRAVYLEGPTDFFARRALLYLNMEDLRQIEATVAKQSDTLSILLEDPSTLGLLRATESLGAATFGTEEASLTLTSRVFGRVFVDQLLNGRPAATVGVKVDPTTITDKLDAQTIAAMKNAPVPPSDQVARSTIANSQLVMDLMSEVLERDGAVVDDKSIAQRLERLRTIDSAALPPRFTMNASKTLLLMEVAAKADITVLENIEPVVNYVKARADVVGQEFPDVTIGLTGMPVQFLEEQGAILDNAVLVTILGLLGILAVFVIGFERVGLPSLAIPPLLMGVVWTLGLQSVVRGELNLLNLLFPVLLFGLGIDFAIHIVSSYGEQRAEGHRIEIALRNALTVILPGLVTGAVTTAAAFFVLLFSSVQGVRDLGLTAGVGVVMALISMLLVLPALLVLWDRYVSEKGQGVPNIEFRALRRVGKFLGTYRYPTMAAFLVVTIALAYFAPQVKLDRDPAKLPPKGMPGQILQDRLLAELKISGEASVFFADDLDEVTRIAKRIHSAKTIANPVIITDAIAQHQEQKTPLIRSLQSRLEALAPTQAPTPHVYDVAEREELAVRVARLKRWVIEISAFANLFYDDTTRMQLGTLRDAVNRVDRLIAIAPSERLVHLDALIGRELERSLEFLRALVHNTRITAADLPTSIISRVQVKDGRYMVLVRAKGYVYEEAYLNQHVAELKSIHSDVTGLVPIWHLMLNKIVKDIPKLTVLTLLAVFLLVLFGLRSLRGAILSLVPLVVGLLWTFGILGLLGIDLNFVSLLAIPLIVGIGIDDGVHLYHRIAEDRDLGAALAHAGKPVILTTMTTGIGFASLLLSVHRGVYSLGITSVIGVTVCLVLSLFLLHALVAIFQEDILRQKPSAATDDDGFDDFLRGNPGEDSTAGGARDSLVGPAESGPRRADVDNGPKHANDYGIPRQEASDDVKNDNDNNADKRDHDGDNDRDYDDDGAKPA